MTGLKKPLDAGEPTPKEKPWGQFGSGMKNTNDTNLAK